ncbi:MAG: lipoate-protein ligase B, partial [Sandarakinorhabdus sp.]|nr:lipoate-protein ligase B [Sandarakinorhabdus sp.]
DIRRYVAALEAWIIASLAMLNVTGRVIAGKVGVWTDTPPAGSFGETLGETAKIAAIGVRVRRWVSYHGIAINVAPDLAHFGGIVPCGLAEPVTSLVALGRATTLADIDTALKTNIAALLGSLSPEPHQ